MDYMAVILRTIFFYFVVLILYRVMGKREVGELSIMDFIVSIFLAQLASISIENLEDNIFILRILFQNMEKQIDENSNCG